MNIGDTVKVYLNWQEEKEFLGKALLLEKIKEGYTFILEDTYEDPYNIDIKYKIPENQTQVYSFNRWRVEFLSLSLLGKKYIKPKEIREYNIRYLDTIGLASSAIHNDIDDHNKLLVDKFLTVNGVEVF